MYTTFWQRLQVLHTISNIGLVHWWNFLYWVNQQREELGLHRLCRNGSQSSNRNFREILMELSNAFILRPTLRMKCINYSNKHFVEQALTKKYTMKISSELHQQQWLQSEGYSLAAWIDPLADRHPQKMSLESQRPPRILPSALCVWHLHHAVVSLGRWPWCLESPGILSGYSSDWWWVWWRLSSSWAVQQGTGSRDSCQTL